jgi:hypothetical protein
MRRNIAFVLLNMDDIHRSEAESWIQKTKKTVQPGT